MPKNLLLSIAAALVFLGCERQAQVPVYLRIDDFKVATDFSDEGTASSRITTVWIEVNGVDVGAYELPIVAPIIANGPSSITITPGINLNGQTSLRNQYEFYRPFETTIDAAGGSEIHLKSVGNNYPVTGYSTFADIIKLEDFEGAGVNFEPTAKSDSSLYVTTDPNELFSEPGLNEVNKKTGKVIVPKGPSVVEFESINSYPLPTFGQNVYLEVNYKCEVNVTFGVFANEANQRIQAPVVTVVPTNGEWKKIYINLVSEVSAYPNAIDYNIFFGTTNTDPNSEKLIYIDNLKLVY